MTATTPAEFTVRLTPEQARSLTENGPDDDSGWCIDCRVFAPAIPTEPGGDSRLCPSCALRWTRRADVGTGAYPEMDAAIVAGLNALALARLPRKDTTS